MSIISLCLVTFFLPETPSWLVSKDRIADAERSLELFRGKNHPKEFKEEMDKLIKRVAEIKNNKSNSILEVIKLPEFYKPIIIMITFFMFQQATGTFVLVTYAVKFSIDIGVSFDPYLYTIFIGLDRILGSISVGFFIERFGRRYCTIYSGLVMSICAFGTNASIIYSDVISYLVPLCLVIVYVLASSIGFLTIPLTLVSELFPLRFRGFASSITISSMYLMAFTMSKLYPFVVDAIGMDNVIIFFGTMALLSMPFVYLCVPETSGKSLDEIEDIFKKKKVHNVDDNNIRLL